MEETVVRQAFVTSGKFRQERIVIGRGADADVVLEGADLSRHHAEITVRNGKVFLKDLGSTNGTFLNSKRITGEESLTSGDVIGVGSHLIVVTVGPEVDGIPEVSLDWGKDAVPGKKRKAGAPPTARLVVRTPAGQTLEFPLDRDEVRVGRTVDNDIRIDDTTVSRHHAVIRREGNAFVVEDLGSSNGTSVGGKRITGPTKVAPGTAIAFGAVGGRIVVGKGKGAPRGRLLLLALVVLAAVLGALVFMRGGGEAGIGLADLYNRGYVTKLIGEAEKKSGMLSEGDRRVLEAAKKLVAASQALKDEKWPLALQLGEEAVALAKAAGVKTAYAEKVVAEARAAIEALEADVESRFAAALEDARLALAAGDLARAETRAKDALTIKRESEEAAAILAQVREERERRRAAALEQAQSAYAQGLAAFKEGRADEALAHLREASALASELGETILAASADEAAAKVKAVLEAYNEAVSKEALSDLAGALAAYRKVVETAGDPEVSYWKQANEAVARLTAQISQEVEAKAALAQQLYDEGRYAEAYELCLMLLELNPGDKRIVSLRAAIDYEIEQNYKKGYWFYKEGDFDKAAEFFRKVADMAPETHPRYADAAEFLGKMGYPLR